MRSPFCATRPRTFWPRPSAGSTRASRSRSARRSRTASTTTSSSPSRSARTLERIEAEIRRELKEGRSWEREEISADEAKQRFASRGRALQGRARRHGRGRDLALHAGRLHRPLPRPAPPGLDADQGDQADAPRRRLLARRRAEHAADPDLRHGLLLAGRSRRVPGATRGGESSATTAGSAASSTSSTSPTSARRARRSGTRRGW